MPSMDIELGVAEKKDELKFLMTAKSRGCFMRKLRFIGDKIQAIEVRKSRFVQVCFFFIKISKKF